jgi:hypothetical protein
MESAFRRSSGCRYERFDVTASKQSATETSRAGMEGRERSVRPG